MGRLYASLRHSITRSRTAICVLKVDSGGGLWRFQRKCRTRWFLPFLLLVRRSEGPQFKVRFAKLLSAPSVRDDTGEGVVLIEHQLCGYPEPLGAAHVACDTILCAIA